MSKHKKRIYFVAVLAKKEIYGEYYKRIVKILEDYGYTVDDDVNHISHKEALAFSESKIGRYFTKVQKLIRNCDIFVAESTAPSPSVGFEVGLAVSYSKPVLILRQDTVEFSLGAPFRAHKNKITVLHYNDKNLKQQIRKFLKKAERGIFIKRLPIEFTQRQLDYIENLKSKYNQRSFNSTVRLIIDKSIEDNSM